MKAKLYSLLTGLLMAACITSYGQEIVSEFTTQNGKEFSDTDIMECSDGTLLTGFSFYSSDYEVSGFMVYKTSFDGQLIDSVEFDNGWNLFSINGAPDNFVIPYYQWDDADSTEFFCMNFIDANLNLSETISVPVFSGLDPQRIALDNLFLTPDNNFIISYWADLVYNGHWDWAEYAMFHLKCISLDGTILSESETDRMLPPNWSTTPPADSALVYGSHGFGILNENPLKIYKMGGYIKTSSNHPWPLIAYFYDENLNLTDTIVYDYLSEDSYFDYAMGEHIVPFEKEESSSYLFAGQIRHPDGKFKSSLVKYDMNHNAVAITSVEPTTIGGNPIETITANDNIIYHAYQSHPSGYSYAVNLARLDGDLNLLWNITMPGGQRDRASGQCLKVLQNNDVAIAYRTTTSSTGSIFHLYIIRDSYDATPENNVSESLFKLYPNPVKDLLTLRFDDGSEPESVELYDLAGRLVGTKSNGLENIDMSAMSTGMYMLRVTMKDGMSYHEKVLKE